MIASISPQREQEFAPSRDRKIHAAAVASLESSKYGPLRKLQCRLVDGVIEISGTVPSFYLKQLAQAAVLQLHPESGVRNLVEVNGESNVLVSTNCVASANR